MKFTFYLYCISILTSFALVAFLSLQLVNWAILALNLLASQYVNHALGRQAAEERLQQISRFLAKTPKPSNCEAELKELYGQLGQPCVLILHCQAVCRMVRIATHHLDTRQEYLQQLLERADLPDGGSSLAEEFAAVGVSDSEEEMDEEDDAEVETVESASPEQPKFEHNTGGTPPLKVRAEEITKLSEPEDEEESMFGTWLRRVRQVMDTVAAVSAALLPPVPVTFKLSQQTSTCVDDPVAAESWLVDLKEGDLVSSEDRVDADAAAFQALLKQRL